jgi:hypothetical protein
MKKSTTKVKPGSFALSWLRDDRYESAFVNEATALTSQRVLGAWEKLRRAVARLLSPEPPRGICFFEATLILYAIVAHRRGPWHVRRRPQESRRHGFLTGRPPLAHTPPVSSPSKVASRPGGARAPPTTA